MKNANTLMLLSAVTAAATVSGVFNFNRGGKLPRGMGGPNFKPDAGLGLETTHGLQLPTLQSNVGAGGVGGGTAVLNPPVAAAAAAAAPVAAAPVLSAATSFSIEQVRTQMQAANKARIAAIDAAFKGWEHVTNAATLRDEAIRDENCTPADFTSKLLNALKSGITPVGTMSAADIAVGASGWERESADMSVALTTQLMPNAEALLNATDNSIAVARGDRVAKALGYANGAEARVAFSKLRGTGVSHMSFQDMALRCLEVGARGRGGQRISRHDHEGMMAAFSHSTSDLPALMRSTVNRTLQATMAVQDTTWRSWCGIGTAKDFRAREIVRTNTITLPQLLKNGKGVAEASMADGYETVGLDTVSLKISFDRKTLINDDLSGIAQQLSRLGTAFELKMEIDAITALEAANVTTLTDTVAFFDSTRTNIGAGEALSYANWLAAVTVMMKRKERGRNETNGVVYINAVPTVLFVPTTLWPVANELCKSEKLPTTGEANTNRDNIVRRRFPMTDIFSPYLDALSTTRWYLFADPALCPALLMSFLNGNQNPIVSQITNGSQLGLEYECIHDHQVDVVNPEGAYRNGA